MSKYLLVIFMSFAIVFSYAVIEDDEPSTTTIDYSKKTSTRGKLTSDSFYLKNTTKISNTSVTESPAVGDTRNEKNDKKSRFAVRQTQSIMDSRGFNCCGPKHDPNTAIQQFDSNVNRIPTDSTRYFQHPNRPIDRYGWQPSSKNGIKYGSGSYNGGNVFAGNRVGDRYGSRPSIHNNGEHLERPNNGQGNYGYGPWYAGPKKPTGVSGTLEDGDEFGPGNGEGVDENGFHHSSQASHIHAQKAVALKALAGVALIGAAAALAANPVLLPLSLATGRRKKRSVNELNDQMDYKFKNLMNQFSSKYEIIKSTKNNSTRCLARLICEIQKRDPDYFEKHRIVKKRNTQSTYKWNDSDANHVNDDHIKKLMQINIFKIHGKNCSAFVCDSIRKLLQK